MIKEQPQSCQVVHTRLVSGEFSRLTALKFFSVSEEHEGKGLYRRASVAAMLAGYLRLRTSYC